jgi:Animal haem peroxidase
MSALKFHGKEPRGLSTTLQSPLFEGSFGRMFRTLPPAKCKEEDLHSLAKQMIAKDEATPTSEDQIDNEENQGIDAGYTYLGQFIDHDLTFDPASSLQKQNDPNGLEDYRTPRFDLDSVYGRGPDDQPYLYESDGVRMLLGKKLTGNDHDSNTRGLQRNSPSSGAKRALIGDPRNDENVIVSQLQSNMIRFHNRMAHVMSRGGIQVTFEQVQQEVRWHYQWVVLHDFLPTIVGQDMLYKILPHLRSGKPIYDEQPRLKVYHYKVRPFMPVEFSVAAYRFGHSMVRPIYRLNKNIPRLPIFAMPPTLSLVGFDEFPDNWAIDWDLFFNPGGAPTTGIGRIQKAYKIDTSLVNPLGSLPAAVVKDMPSLAERNLVRGLRMGLPSGQAVARFLGEKVIADGNLRIGKATQEDQANNPLLSAIAPSCKDQTPLWFYVLAEAQQQFVNDSTAIHLGPVGGRIVAEVFIGLLLGDPHSFLVQQPDWKPRADMMQAGTFRMKDLLGQAAKDQELVTKPEAMAEHS